MPSVISVHAHVGSSSAPIPAAEFKDNDPWVLRMGGRFILHINGKPFKVKGHYYF
ncbi:hypothetical protein BDR03DRAFT_1019521 [Suillus americanus]|nr:hypothetical protein BDR03DRAFT_1019521 [Suillus americanus]